jgi:hypothetical protein
MASVFAQGRYVGAILHRGVAGYEAIGDGGTSHGLFNSQKEGSGCVAADSAACGLLWD